jgi:hypothetical protein
LRKIRGGGEKLGGVGFLMWILHFYSKVEGRRAWVLFILCKFFVIFSKFWKGKRAWFFFHFFLKKILKVGSGLGVWGSFIFIFCYSFIIWNFFATFCLFLKGEGGMSFFHFFLFLNWGSGCGFYFFTFCYFFNSWRGRGA